MVNHNSGRSERAARGLSVDEGSGGSAMMKLISEVILSNVTRYGCGGVTLRELDDSGSIVVGDLEIVLTTDAHTIKPIFFPGGDIGSLAASGTLNDVSVMGVKPRAISFSMVVEEGFSKDDLSRIVRSFNGVLEEVGVDLITGDTKVLEKGDIDGVVVTTSAIGVTQKGRIVRDSGIRPGDIIIISGSVGDHGISILSVREGFDFQLETKSDVGPIWEVVEAALEAAGAEGVRAMKDPTRGGLSNALNELAEKSGVGMEIREEEIPIRQDIASAAEMLGVDPLSVTNEGKAIIAVDPELSDDVLAALRRTRRGRDAAIIGRAVADHVGEVVMETKVGGKRLLERPIGDPAPRIC